MLVPLFLVFQVFRMRLKMLSAGLLWGRIIMDLIVFLLFEIYSTDSLWSFITKPPAAVQLQTNIPADSESDLDTEETLTVGIKLLAVL